MPPKLFCFVHGGQDVTLEPNGHREWIVGRAHPSSPEHGIYFRGPRAQWVSRRHAIVGWHSTTDTDSSIGYWRIQHVSTTENVWTFYETKGSLPDIKLEPYQWQKINEGDTFYFGLKEFAVTFSLRDDSTLQQQKIIPETPPPVTIEEDDDAPWWSAYPEAIWAWFTGLHWAMQLIVLALLSALVVVWIMNE